MTSAEHVSTASTLDDQLEVTFCLSSNGERIRNQDLSSCNKKADPETKKKGKKKSNYSGSLGIAVPCKRISISLRARDFLLHLGLELHLAFHPVGKQ